MLRTDGREGHGASALVAVNGRRGRTAAWFVVGAILIAVAGCPAAVPPPRPPDTVEEPATAVVEPAAAEPAEPVGPDVRERLRPPPPLAARDVCADLSARRCLEAGRDHRERGRTVEAYEAFDRACTMGNAAACCDLFADVIDLESGEDPYGTEDACRRACEADDDHGCLFHAYMLTRAGMWDEARPLLRRACEAGFFGGCDTLSIMAAAAEEPWRDPDGVYLMEQCERGTATACVAGAWLHAEAGDEEGRVAALERGCRADSRTACERWVDALQRDGRNDEARRAAGWAAAHRMPVPGWLVDQEPGETFDETDAEACVSGYDGGGFAACWRRDLTIETAARSDDALARIDAACAEDDVEACRTLVTLLDYRIEELARYDGLAALAAAGLRTCELGGPCAVDHMVFPGLPPEAARAGAEAYYRHVCGGGSAWVCEHFLTSATGLAEVAAPLAEVLVAGCLAGEQVACETFERVLDDSWWPLDPDLLEGACESAGPAVLCRALGLELRGARRPEEAAEAFRRACDLGDRGSCE